jgi:hypothetical protein
MMLYCFALLKALRDDEPRGNDSDPTLYLELGRRLDG